MYRCLGTERALTRVCSRLLLGAAHARAFGQFSHAARSSASTISGYVCTLIETSARCLQQSEFNKLRQGDASRKTLGAHQKRTFGNQISLERSDNPRRRFLPEEGGAWRAGSREFPFGAGVREHNPFEMRGIFRHQMIFLQFRRHSPQPLSYTACVSNGMALVSQTPCFDSLRGCHTSGDRLPGAQFPGQMLVAACKGRYRTRSRSAEFWKVAS